MALDETALHKVVAERLKLGLILTTLMLIFYFGFILLVAFDKPLLSILLSPGQLGDLLGGLVIVSAWVLSTIYVLWANKRYDRIVAEAVHAAMSAGTMPRKKS